MPCKGPVDTGETGCDWQFGYDTFEGPLRQKLTFHQGRTAFHILYVNYSFYIHSKWKSELHARRFLIGEILSQ